VLLVTQVIAVEFPALAYLSSSSLKKESSDNVSLHNSSCTATYFPNYLFTRVSKLSPNDLILTSCVVGAAG